MNRRYKNTFRSKMLEFINNMSGTIVLRCDVAHLGSDRQISRGFKALVEDGDLVKIAHGVYARANPSPNPQLVDRPIIRSGFTIACVEALQRLNIPWEPCQATKAYNAGTSQQVPAHFIVRLQTRFRRPISYGRRQLRIEGNINAR